MNLYLKVFCIALLAMMELSALAAPDDGPTEHSTAILAATLAKLDLKNPIADLETNLKRHDLRFIGIYGISCDTPGVGEADQKFVFLLVFVNRHLAA